MLDKIRVLIELKRDLNKVDENGNILLHEAVRNGNLEAVQLLLENGAVVDLTDEMGNTALMLASWNGEKDLVSLLVQEGADINSVNRWGYTPLICASSKRQSAVGAILLSLGADPEVENIEGDTALLIASKQDDTELLSNLFLKGADIHHQNKNGLDSLMLAALVGAENAVQLLLKSGADVSKTSKEGYTALMYASEQGYLNIVQMLTDWGVDLSMKNKNGLKAVDLAYAGGKKEIVNYFFDKMGEEALEPQYRELPKKFFSAVSKGDMVAVKEMLSWGVDINKPDSYGTTPLMAASFKGYETLVRYLIDSGADMELRDQNGLTAIDYAVKNEKYEVAALIKKSIENEKKVPRIFNAVAKGDYNRLKRFIEMGFDVNSKDVDGNFVLMNAVLKADMDIVQLLLENGALGNLKNKKGEGIIDQIEKLETSSLKLVQMVALLQKFKISLQQPSVSGCFIEDIVLSKGKNPTEKKIAKKLLDSLGLRTKGTLSKSKDMDRM